MNSLPARRIGQTELEVSVLGLGGAPLGDLYERIPEERALATLETAYRRGIRFLTLRRCTDTACRNIGLVMCSGASRALILLSRRRSVVGSAPSAANELTAVSSSGTQFPNRLRLQLRWNDARARAELPTPRHVSSRYCAHP